MSKKRTNKRNGRAMDWVQRLVVLLAIVLLTVTVAVLIWAVISNIVNSNDPVASTPAQTQKFPSLPTTVDSEPIQLGNGLVITGLAPYTGAYMEDGTDHVVSDVLMAILENTSDQALQYAQITLHFGDKKAEFSVTNLPAKQRVVLLEKNRMEYTKAEPDRAEMRDVVFLPKFELHEDIFEITGEKGTLTIRNISDSDVSGDIYVYYKNTSKDLLYGGITYRAKVDGGLRAGESKQIIASHYNPTGSVVLMVTFIPT